MARFNKPTVRTREIYDSPTTLIFACDVIPVGEKPMLMFRIAQGIDGWESNVIIDGVWHRLVDAPTRGKGEAMRWCYNYACGYFEEGEDEQERLDIGNQRPTLDGRVEECALW